LRGRRTQDFLDKIIIIPTEKKNGAKDRKLDNKLSFNDHIFDTVGPYIKRNFLNARANVFVSG